MYYYYYHSNSTPAYILHSDKVLELWMRLLKVWMHVKRLWDNNCGEILFWQVNLTSDMTTRSIHLYTTQLFSCWRWSLLLWRFWGALPFGVEIQVEKCSQLEHSDHTSGIRWDLTSLSYVGCQCQTGTLGIHLPQHNNTTQTHATPHTMHHTHTVIQLFFLAHLLGCECCLVWCMCPSSTFWFSKSSCDCGSVAIRTRRTALKENDDAKLELNGQQTWKGFCWLCWCTCIKKFPLNILVNFFVAELWIY